jgi:predicted Zn-dependent protease with MMP-like domain
VRRRRFRRDPDPPIPAEVAAPAARPAAGDRTRTARRGRDRRSRGLRGPLAPPESPLTRSRAEIFADLVLDAVERLERRWRRELQDVEFAVEDVPPADGAAAGPVPLGRLYRGGAGQDARIVLYRRPIEARAAGRADLAALVHDLLVEQVADLIGVEPETIDPDYGLD